MFLVIRRQICASASQGDAKRGSRDNHKQGQIKPTDECGSIPAFRKAIWAAGGSGAAQRDGK
jgi:hypothetical protein